jgi:hypothetical protein
MQQSIRQLLCCGRARRALEAFFADGLTSNQTHAPQTPAAQIYRAKKIMRGSGSCRVHNGSHEREAIYARHLRQKTRSGLCFRTAVIAQLATVGFSDDHA